MAPKKKKEGPRNAYFYFMTELQRTQGGRYGGSLREVAVAAAPLWNNMDAAARQPFEQMAKRERAGVKYTTQGLTFDEVNQAQKEAKDKQELMLSTIKNNLIQLGRNTGFKTAPFFFVHINYFCKKDDGTYYPAEFALTMFSIKDGTKTTYHTMVQLGNLPQGYNLKAKEHTADTHKIPLPPDVPNPVTDSIVLMDAIEKYVRDNNDGEPMPPFYTMETFIPSVENMMSRWAVDYGRDADYFRIFSLEQLLYDMKMFSLKPLGQRPTIRGVIDDGFQYVSLAKSVLQEDLFMYRPKIACVYHEKEDASNQCSRSWVIRWCWTFANNLCCNMDVPMIPSQHCPVETAPEDLAVLNQEIDRLAIEEPYESAPCRRGRTEHPPSKAFGRGKPIVPASSLNPGGPVNRMSGSHSALPFGGLEIIDHGALRDKTDRVGLGTSVLLPSPPPWAQHSKQPAGKPRQVPVIPDAYALVPQTLIIPEPAVSVTESDNRASEPEQFNDADTPSRPHTNRAKYDPTPLRLPKTISLALQIGQAGQVGDMDQAAGFSSNDFRAFGLGRGAVPPVASRRGSSRGSRGNSRGVRPAYDQ